MPESNSQAAQLMAQMIGRKVASLRSGAQADLYRQEGACAAFGAALQKTTELQQNLKEGSKGAQGKALQQVNELLNGLLRAAQLQIMLCRGREQQAGEVLGVCQGLYGDPPEPTAPAAPQGAIQPPGDAQAPAPGQASAPSPETSPGAPAEPRARSLPGRLYAQQASGREDA